MSKQFMVLKMVSTGLKGALNIVPMMALVSRDLAEEAVQKFTKDDPEAIFLIQEVGRA